MGYRSKPDSPVLEVKGGLVLAATVPSGHGDTLSRRRAASPLVMLVEVKRGGETPDHPASSRNWGGTEENRTINCASGP
ncbi:hypothetical protein TNCV_2704211 [Trichonephila clavipes]|nr:hypothetical protein TNCV_2704211 [Trichonephila clavipes]